MILLIDIGNSRTKYVHYLDGSLTEIVQVINTDFNAAYFEQHYRQASQVIVANVANAALTKILASWCASQRIDFLQVHSEQKRGNLTSAYQDPSTLGIDRWLALLGAMYLYPNESVLIIDAGTATTIDLVEHTGQHQGGWILAGIEALFNSILSNSTLVHAKSRSEDTDLPSLAFGSNTSDNVNNACWAATFGMVKEGIEQAKQLGKFEHILFTGGNGEALAELLIEQQNKQKTSIQKVSYIDNLIFYGLQKYIPKERLPK